MKIFTHNFNPKSNSGPNKFTRTLFQNLIQSEKVTLSDQPSADVEFCLIQQQVHKVKPMVLRLDGIYFNSEQDFNQQNAPIKFSYENADAVIFQSNFNKKLTEYWFGPHKNSHIIHNAADASLIKRVNGNFWNRKFTSDVEVWSCASNWRPHKRLKDNVRYFKEFAPENAVFAIAGGLGMDEAKEIINMDDRVNLLGDLDYASLLALYKRSSTFVHLAYLDHCPNVVVDAQASGCNIVCSSSGGTKEIVTKGTVVLEEDWDMTPCALYKPPVMDFSKRRSVTQAESIDTFKHFQKCVDSYFDVMESIK